MNTNHKHAIIINFNTEFLKKEFDEDSYPDAYYTVANKLSKFGFTVFQDNIYFYEGSNSIAKIFEAVKHLSSIKWFKKSVSNVSVCKISDLSDFTCVFRD